MRITSLNTNPEIYSSNVYLVRGDYNSLDDVNTLIDAGNGFDIISEIQRINTGAGKKPVEQIILTHDHFDHIGGLKDLNDAYNPRVLAWKRDLHVDIILQDDDMIRIADSFFQVIHTPGHSQDSICLYNYESRILFSGDTPVNIRTPGDSYTPEYITAFERLCSLKVDIIYPGHGDPIINKDQNVLHNSLRIIKNRSFLF